MTITLDPEIAEHVNQKIVSGEFASADEVVSAALCYYLENESDDPLPLEQLREEIVRTEHSKYTTYTAETLKTRFEEIKAEERRRLATRR
jgi:putative addiction module CopG family antidote